MRTATENCYWPAREPHLPTLPAIPHAFLAAAEDSWRGPPSGQAWKPGPPSRAELDPPRKEGKGGSQKELSAWEKAGGDSPESKIFPKIQK